MEFRTLDDLNKATARNDRASAVPWLVRSFVVGERPAEFAEAHGARPAVVDHVRAATTAMTTISDPVGVDARAAAYLSLTEHVRILPQIPGASRCPMNLVGVVLDEDEIVGSWLRDGIGRIAFQAFSTDDRTMTPYLFAFGFTMSNTFARSLNPVVNTLIQKRLNGGITHLENRYALDDEPAATGVRPAGLLFGTSPLDVSPISDPVEAIADLWTAVRNGEPTSPAFITSKAGAFLLATWATDGERRFPDVRVDGRGHIAGTPVLVCPEAGARLILLDGASLLWSDAGLVIRRSEQTSILQSDAPGDGPQNATSMFQTDSTAVTVTRTIDWAWATNDAVAFVTLPLGSPQ